MSKTILIIIVIMIAPVLLMSCMPADEKEFEEEMEFYLSITVAEAIYDSSSNSTFFRVWMYADGANLNSLGSLQEDWSLVLSEGDTALVEINKDNMYAILGEDLEYIFYSDINPPGSAMVALDNFNTETKGDIFNGNHPDKAKFSAIVHDDNGKNHHLTTEHEFYCP